MLRLSQSELAKEVGCSQGTISQVEAGKVTPSEAMGSRILKVLREDEPVAVRVSNVPIHRAVEFQFRMPKQERSSDHPGSLPFTTSIWQQPRLTGDFVHMYHPSKDSLILVAGDVVGRGRAVMPLTQFTIGWLTGFLQSQIDTPRLEDIVGALSKMAVRAGFELGVFILILVRSPSDRGVVSYEAASFGFPPPLLLLDPPLRTSESSQLQEPIPLTDKQIHVTRYSKLEGPWRLVIASDGLLARFGYGDEAEGKKRLYEWQSSSRRDIDPSSVLRYPQTRYQRADDELFVRMMWNYWNIKTVSPTTDTDSIRQFCDKVIDEASRFVQFDAVLGFGRAVLEAINNVRRHAYLGKPGDIMLRFRKESEYLRIEVEDNGRGGITKSMMDKHESGFAIIRQYTTRWDIRDNSTGGSIISMVLSITPEGVE